MTEKTPDQAYTHDLALDELRILGDLLSCLDAAGYDPKETQRLQLILAAHLRSQAGRPVPGLEEGDQALRPAPPVEALLDSLDTAALIARSSLGIPSARRIRNLTSDSQIAEIVRRRDQLASSGQQPPAAPGKTGITETAPTAALPAEDLRSAADTHPRRRGKWRFRMPSATTNLLITLSGAQAEISSQLDAATAESGQTPPRSQILDELLTSHPEAASLLAEASHCHALASSSAANVGQAFTAAQAARLSYEELRHRLDPRRRRTIHFGAGLILLIVLGGMGSVLPTLAATAHRSWVFGVLVGVFILVLVAGAAVLTHMESASLFLARRRWHRARAAHEAAVQTEQADVGGPLVVRIAAVVPVVLLVLFTGLLWLLGLMCGRERRRYVTDLNRQAMEAISVLLHGPPAPPSPRTTHTRAVRR